MKTFIITAAMALGLMSLTACSSMDGNTGTSSNITNNTPVSLVPFPDTQVSTTQTTPIPNPAGAPAGPETPPK